MAVGGTQLSTDSRWQLYQRNRLERQRRRHQHLASRKPSYQQGVVTQTSNHRAVPDVAYDGSSNSPFAIYDTSSYSGWLQVYGTSAGAPQWAALVAIADQGRALNGQGSLDGGSQTLPAIYQLPQSDFHDITSGSNGGYSAGVGYDLVTGRGSPLANLVVAGLVSYGVQSPPTYQAPWVATPASSSSSTVSGTTTNLSVLGGDNYNVGTLTYTWSVLSEPSGAADPTFSANGTNAAHSTTVLFHNAGNYTFQVTITNIYGLSTTSAVNVTVNQTVSAISLTPANGSVYNNGTLTLTATATDQFGHAMSTQPGWNWSLGGAGSLGGNGQYTAPISGTGTATVYVSGDGLTQAATVTFTAAPSSTFPDPGQTWSAWLHFLDSWMSQLSQFQSLWQLLLGSWHGH